MTNQHETIEQRLGRLERQSQLPPHLDTLMQPTPSGVTKLIAAWDGLHTETQIEIISRLASARYPAYLAEKVRAKAFENQNSYIRYLAYRGFYLDRNDIKSQQVKARIEADRDPLVRFSILENEWAIADPEIKSPELFFRLPHEARLAKVRELNGHGEEIASLISFAVENLLKEGVVSEFELYEVLADYLTRPSFRTRYSEDNWHHSYDGYAVYSAGKEMDALWGVVAKSPPPVSLVLIEALPVNYGLGSGIPKDVLNRLDRHQLQALLYRRDVVLTDFRKEVFNRPAKHLDSLRCAAISHNFDLENAEFAIILSMQESEKMDVLRDLATSASDLRLCVYDAIHDILFSTEATAFGGAWEDASRAHNSLERRLKHLSEWRRDRELKELRLYRLAHRAVPSKKDQMGYAPSNDLEFLAQHVVPGDTWRTYMAFEGAWNRLMDGKAKHLEGELPPVDELDEAADTEKPKAAIASQEAVNETLALLGLRIGRLQSSNSKLQVILYVIIALLLIVLWKLK